MYVFKYAISMYVFKYAISMYVFKYAISMRMYVFKYAISMYALIPAPLLGNYCLFSDDDNPFLTNNLADLFSSS